MWRQPDLLYSCADIDLVLGPADGFRQSRIVEDARDRVAGLAHGIPDRAFRLAQAVFAPSIRRLACAWHQRQRPVDIAHDLAKGDRFRWLGERVAAMLAPGAPNQAVTFQFQQYQFQELARHMLALGDLRDLRRLARRLISQVEQGVQGVFGLLREHTYSINPIEIIDLALP